MENYDQILLEVATSEDIDRGIILGAANRITTSAVEGLGVTQASIWLFDNHLNEVSCLTIFPASSSAEHLRVFDVEEFNLVANALSNSRFLAINDLDKSALKNTAVLRHAQQHGCQSLLNCAIRYRGDLIGILHCTDDKPRTWSDKEKEFSANLADMVGRALSAQRWQSAKDELSWANRRLEERVEERTREVSDALEQLQIMQKQLVESEKMAALGGLVAGVAHEINTPLGICITGTSHLRTRKNFINDRFKAGTVTESDLQKFLDTTEEIANLLDLQLTRSAKLVKSFKQLAVDQSVDELEVFNVKTKLETLLVSLNHELKIKSINMTLECPECLNITNYPGAFDQVITNLVMNSILHGFEDSDHGNVMVSIHPEGETIIIHFSDDGTGIPPENENKIFNPFFTTSRNKGGTGLGLHILYNLVTHKMKGNVRLLRNGQHGAHFEINLPIQLIETSREESPYENKAN